MVNGKMLGSRLVVLIRRGPTDRWVSMRTSEECFKAYSVIKSELPLYPLDSQTEADTRARLISRVLHEALDWPHENVNREESAHPGFMDYVLLTNRRLAVLEAKKSGDSFLLPDDISTAKNFTLGGILRTVKNLNAYIAQVSAYCYSNGIEYAIVSNGLQYVVFRAVRNDGIHIGQGRVIVFNGFQDIENRFVEFWSLLAKRNVEENSLQRAFQSADMPIFQYRRVSEELHRYKEKVSRNSLSLALEPLISEYLGEITDEMSRDKLKRFFVKNRALAQVLSAVEQRIAFHLSETVRTSANIVEPARHEDLRKGLKRKLDTHMSLPPKGSVLLLLGRVGSGKTTFMNQFMRVELKDVLDKHVLVAFDFRLLEKGGNVGKFFYQALHDSLNKNSVFGRLSSKQLRQVYSSDIRALTIGPLANIEKMNKKLY
jgi:predicted type IV restriction endonuclease